MTSGFVARTSRAASSPITPASLLSNSGRAVPPPPQEHRKHNTRLTGTPAIAQPQAYLIPKGTATARLLAHVLTAQFAYTIPFYRQAKQFERIGVELSRTTLCGWTLQVAERCAPGLDLLGQEVRAGPVVRCDETTRQVLDEPDRPATTKSYMWVFHGGPPGHPAVEYRYHPTRAGQVAADYLVEYQGCVQTAGFSGHGFLDTHPRPPTR